MNTSLSKMPSRLLDAYRQGVFKECYNCGAVGKYVDVPDTTHNINHQLVTFSNHKCTACGDVMGNCKNKSVLASI